MRFRSSILDIFLQQPNYCRLPLRILISTKLPTRFIAALLVHHCLRDLIPSELWG
jgi:hypothetical protein